MASYHCSIKAPLSRGKGKSLIAKAAYNARTQYKNEREGTLTRDYRKHGELLAEPYVIYDNRIKAPDWVKNDPEKMLNQAVAGLRKNGREGQEIIVGLIDELSLERNKQLLHDFIREQICRKTGHVVFVNIHEPSKDGDDRNIHAHLLLMPRGLNKDGFTEALPGLNPADYDRIREKWAEYGARELLKEGHDLEAERYRWGHLKLRHEADDRRSWNGNNQYDKAYKRGDTDWMVNCDREAKKHMGAQKTAMERERKIPTHNGDFNRDNDERNRHRQNDRDLNDRMRQEQWDADRPPKENPFQQGREAIREIYRKSENVSDFQRRLAGQDFDLARVTKEEAEHSKVLNKNWKAAGKYKPLFREGEYLVVDQEQRCFRLTPQTTGAEFKEIRAFMKPLDRTRVPGLHPTLERVGAHVAEKEAQRSNELAMINALNGGRRQGPRFEPKPGREEHGRGSRFRSRAAERAAAGTAVAFGGAIFDLLDRPLTPLERRDAALAKYDREKAEQEQRVREGGFERDR
jgi:hypothetical protein